MGQIYFTIMDNGVGIPQEKLSTLLTTDSSGYGLKNVHDRLILASRIWRRLWTDY